MMDYREIDPGDFAALSALLCEVWRAENYIDDPALALQYAAANLHEVLAPASYGQLAESGGQLAGVLLGEVFGAPPLFDASALQAAFAADEAALRAAPPSARQLLQKLDVACRTPDEQMADRRAEFDGHIWLLAVRRAARGQGVGRRLMENFAACARAQGAGRVYLFTDTYCDYSFYEHLGFTCIGREPRTVFAGRPFANLVYAGTL